MRKYKAQLIRIREIAGMYYRSEKPRDILVIYGIGAPIVPDNGNLPDAKNILEFDVDLLVPDYIGYGRSSGVCTPLNCIKTFLNLYKDISLGCKGVNYYESSNTNLHYKRIICIGRSFGGTYVPLLPRFNSSIKELGIIYPAVDNSSCGSILGEETNEDFMRSMRRDGYKYLYRGILAEVWEKHLKDEDGLSPMDNISYLRNAKLFVGHGKKDKCIHFSKSVTYYENILQQFPDRKNQFKLRLYEDSGHEPKTSNRAVKDFFNFLNIRKYGDRVI